MSYCLNPNCATPNNLTDTNVCQACGSKLLLRDRYRSTQVLGRGGFGTTFLAQDEGLPGQPTCVIKQLRPVLTAPHIVDMARELFKREAATLGKIGNHPQLPRLLDYFDADQEFYLVQEYVSGATLQQEVKRFGPLNEAATIAVLKEVLPLLDYLHSQEVIHRDIKPANLIRRSIDNRLVLIDFGAVKDRVSQTMAANPQEYSTLTAFAVGTPGFAPPEQMAMRPVYASDLYSLGVTCIYLLTAKSPKDLQYDPATGEMLWRNYVQVSDHFHSILDKLLEVSVRHRFQSAKEALQALEQEPPTDLLPPDLSSHRSASAPPPPTSPAPYSSSATSPYSRGAMSIRSHHARHEASASALGNTAARTQGHASRSQPSPYSRAHIQRTSGDSGEIRGKLNASGLLQSYSRGRRDFTQQDLSRFDLKKANLPNAVFHQAKLQQTDLRGANLYSVNLGRASLVGAVLRDCNLTKAYMSYADFEGADLRGANLSEAHLNNANLRGANLSGANLTGSTLTPAQIAQARTNWLTIMPSGRRGRW